LALSAAACSPGSGSEWQKAYGKTFYEPNEGMAALYIVRDDPGSDASPIGITMNQYPSGSLASLTWMRLDLPPSLYDLRAYGTQGNTELIVTVNAGQSRFLLAEPKPPGNAQLREITQEVGRQLVRKGQPVASSP
jgi:hypothetical protein